MVDKEKPPLDYEKVKAGDTLGSYEYVLTQGQIDRHRESVDDPGAEFPTIAIKHDATALGLAFAHNSGGGVNARGEAEFFNVPVPGKKIFVTGRIVDKYIRRDKPYLVIEAEAKDEDGRLIERTRTYQMKKPDEVGKKWGT